MYNKTYLSSFDFHIEWSKLRSITCEPLRNSIVLKWHNFTWSLCLEWNSMGMLETAFSVFCEGLSCNTRLQVLDLRNNQISHDGATHIASALKVNTTLKSLGKVLSDFWTAMEGKKLQLSCGEIFFFFPVVTLNIFLIQIYVGIMSGW